MVFVSNDARGASVITSQKLLCAIAEFNGVILKHIGKDSMITNYEEDTVENVLLGLATSYDSSPLRIVRAVSDRYVRLKLFLDSDYVFPQNKRGVRWVQMKTVNFSRQKIERLTTQRRLEEQ